MNTTPTKTHSGSFTACTLVFVGVVGLVNCVPPAPGDGVTGPTPPSDLAVTGTAEPAETFEGGNASLSAEATGGSAPYRFRWDQNGGPADAVLSNSTSDALSVGPFTAPGRYVFRVVVTDAQERHAAEYVPMDVLPAVEATVPDLAVIGEPVTLAATVDPAAGDVGLQWEVTEGTATIDDPTSTAARLTTSVEETVHVRLTISLPGGANNERTFEIVSVADLTPRVLVETSMGDFTIELDAVAAPQHAVNFLLYVDDSFYDGLIFHRVVCADNDETGECDPFVIQTGGYERVDGELEPVEATRDPVTSEADNGLSNGVQYTVALALLGSDVNSGQAQFFVNMKDNGFLDDLAFTVFGSVTDGTDVVDAISAVEVEASPVIPGEVSLPVEDVILERISRLSIGD